MDINECYAQYCQFWTLFEAEEEFRNRRACTFAQWQLRSVAAQKAMIIKLEKDGPPRHRNPFFWVIDFPEPQPEWLRGDEKDLDIVQVFHEGRYRLCTRETMTTFNLQYVMDWK